MPLWKRNLIICWFGCFVTMVGTSLVIPFLPLYIVQLGVTNVSSIAKWSGFAYSATFILSAIVSPIWGKLADKHGRKLMLLRASLGMAIIMVLIGCVHNVYQLVLLRLLMGAVNGYVPAAITLVVTQTPKEHSGWALGTLSTGSVGGILIGPLIGGMLSEVIGLNHVFFVTGGVMFLAFLISLLFVREDFIRSSSSDLKANQLWKLIKQPQMLLVMFLTTFMIQFATMSIEPIVTLYVKQLLLHDLSHVALVSGAVISASGLASILTASQLGKIADRKGSMKVLIISLVLAGLIFIPQAFVQSPWQLMGLRFLFGLTTAGMLPAVNSLVKRSVPDSISGRVFGYNQSAQYLGNIAGPILGGQVAAAWGFKYVFFSTSALLLLNAIGVYFTGEISLRRGSDVTGIGTTSRIL